MGTFGKSFSRELGKNTGKFVSNAVFGDKWSTPYRTTSSVRVIQARAEAEGRAAQAKAEVEKARINQEMEQEKMMAIEEMRKADQKANEILQIRQIQFTNNKDENHSFLTELCIIYEGSSEKEVKKAASSKIEDGIFKLRQLGATIEADYFQVKLDRPKKAKKRRQIITISILAIVIILTIIGLKAQKKAQDEMFEKLQNEYNENSEMQQLQDSLEKEALKDLKK